MKELGFRIWPSHANFIYFDPMCDVQWFADRMLDYGIIIRGNFKRTVSPSARPKRTFSCATPCGRSSPASKNNPAKFRL
jgi:hypothetical protein